MHDLKCSLFLSNFKINLNQIILLKTNKSILLLQQLMNYNKIIKNISNAAAVAISDKSDEFWIKS